MTESEKNRMLAQEIEKIKTCNYSGCCTPLVYAILFVVILFFSSCATKTKIEYRDRDVNHYITNTEHDTLIQHTHDSIYHTVFQKGDTVYDTKYVEKTRWRDRIVERHDTCWRDSVVTEYKEIEKEVIKIPKIYQISLFVSILFIIFASIKITKIWK